MKKTLATRLNERTDTIEYRAIVKQCMNVAQNKGTFILRLSIEQKTIMQLQNEMLTVTQFEEYGCKKYKISW